MMMAWSDMKNHKILNLLFFDALYHESDYDESDYYDSDYHDSDYHEFDYHESEFEFEDLNVQLFALLTPHVWLRLNSLGN